MMEELTDDSLDDDLERPLERWAPLGAANASPLTSESEPARLDDGDHTERLACLEAEQEQLNSSLLALTTHFAQVQFRLKQIVSAEPNLKEDLLKELEEFAFRGIPDMRYYSSKDSVACEGMSEKDHDEKIKQQREKQLELIDQLKCQLEDLETYAYETGSADIPTSKVMEKQKVVIDQLKNKLQVEDFEHLDKLSTDELRQAVDRAIGQIVKPAKVKEKIIDQLKTQIVDLERFIEFLQDESQGVSSGGCTCPLHGQSSSTGVAGVRAEKAAELGNNKNFHSQTYSVMRQALTLLQIFAITQFGCGSREFQKNLLKRTTKGNHWGDLRARLEVAIGRVLDLVRQLQQQKAASLTDEQQTSVCDEEEPLPVEHELVMVVRKELAIALRDLLQHGLMEVNQGQSLVPLFGCLSSRSSSDSAQMMHAWDLFLRYYENKHGKEYNDAPVRKLSQSFSLDIVGGKAITPKQTLLTAIEEITSSHRPLKRNEDSQFKAFVCLGLNQKKLVMWLRVLLRNTWLVEYYYQPWSYVVRTGFDDALVSLDKLMTTNFQLPIDLAVRPFHNIKDAF